MLLRVHPSNFRIIGFTERPTLKQFVELGRRKNIPTFEDLGSGCLFDVRDVGIHDEPVAGDSIRAGVDIICFSGDKLLGGPQAGIIAGKKLFVDRIRQNPLFRALRVDKLTIAALESILIAVLEGRVDEIPIWRMLRTPAEKLRTRAEAFAKAAGAVARVIELMSLVGGGSAPEAELPSWGVVLRVEGLSETQLEERLRSAEPPVIVRIEDNQVILDLRTVSESEEKELLGIVRGLG